MTVDHSLLEIAPRATKTDQQAARRPRLSLRLRGRHVGELVIETLIRICGVSAVLFVFGIFFFVFREGAGFLFHGLNLREFLFSTAWYPTSQRHVRFGPL